MTTYELLQKFRDEGNSSIILSEDAYDEVKAKLNPRNILYDDETGTEMLKPGIIFRRTK